MIKGYLKNNLVGKQFSRLFVLEISHRTNKGHIYYKCQCDCGIIKIIRADALITGKTVSCGCRRNENLSYHEGRHIKYTMQESSIRGLFGDYILGAKKRGIPFELSLEIFTQLIQKKCYYCNSELSNNFYNRFHKKYFNYNGIDRLDSSKGYFIDNCVPCCKTCNTAKMEQSETDFLNWITKVYQFKVKNKLEA